MEYFYCPLHQSSIEHRKVPLNDDVARLDEFEAEVARTGKHPAEVIRNGVNKPDDLSEKIVAHWRSGANANARLHHWYWMMGNYAELPDAPKASATPSPGPA